MKTTAPSSIPDPTADPFAYLRLISQDLRAKGDNTAANGVLDAMAALRGERDSLAESCIDLYAGLTTGLKPGMFHTSIRGKALDALFKVMGGDVARIALAKAMGA